MNARSIWIDVDNSTFLIGALSRGSFLVDTGYVVDNIRHFEILISTITGRPTGPSFDPNLLPLASTMAWVENFLNLTKGYYKVTSSEGDQFEYLVPFPSGYTSTMKAYWTTDIIVLDPSCSWQTATTTGPVKSTWDVTLSKSNLSVSLENDDFGMFLLSSNVFMCLLDFSIKPC